MTAKQIEMARHALGLPNKKNTTYRNHFCIPPGSEGYEDWEQLVADGMAVKAIGGAGWSGDFFYLTLTGAKAVLQTKEHLSREDAAKMHGIDVGQRNSA